MADKKISETTTVVTLPDNALIPAIDMARALGDRNIAITKSNLIPTTSPLTTKGDIYVHNGTTNVRLPIGTDAQILEADSVEATGLKWVDNTGTGIDIKDTFNGKLYAWFWNIDVGTMYIGNGGPVTTGTGSNIASVAGSVSVNQTWDRRQINGTECGLREDDVSPCFFGNGFYFECQFSRSDSSSTNVEFFGLTSSNAVLGNVDPSTLINIFGIGLDASDSNFHFIHNDGAGTATKTDLGVNFDRTLLPTDLSFNVEMYQAFNTTNLFYKITNLESDLGTGWVEVTTNLPAVLTKLYPQLYMNVGTGAVVSNQMQNHFLKVIRFA